MPELLLEQKTNQTSVGCEPTPIDELTKIPQLFVPSDEALFLLQHPQINAARRAEEYDFADLNHAYHPKRSPELMSEDGKAIRDCRGQTVMRSEHNKYHKIYSGPQLPKTTDERIRAVVFCAAGYVPRQALDFRGDKPVTVNLTDEQVLRLQTSGEVRMVQDVSIRNFLARCVRKSPEVDHIPLRLIDEFLTIKPETADDIKRQRFLIHKLLSMAIDPVTAPLYSAYKISKDNNLWRPDLGVGPRKVVHNQIIGRSQRSRAQSIRKIGELLQDKFLIYKDLAPAA